MMKILRLVVLAFLLFIGLTEVLPWIRGRVEGISKSKITGQPDRMAGEVGTCMHLATQANALVGDEIYNAKPPPADSTGWVEASDEIHRRINEADSVCTCPDAGCETAREAMRELESLVDDIDQMIAGQGSGALALASRQDRVDLLLSQARLEAR